MTEPGIFYIYGDISFSVTFLIDVLLKVNLVAFKSKQFMTLCKS
jgi:hypothetical protein